MSKNKTILSKVNEYSAFFAQDFEVVCSLIAIIGGEANKNNLQLVDGLLKTVNYYGVDRHSHIGKGIEINDVNTELIKNASDWLIKV